MLENYNLNRYKGGKSGNPESDWLYEVTSAEAPESSLDLAWEKTSKKLQGNPVNKKHKFLSFSVAASLALLGACIYLFNGYFGNSSELVVAQSGDSKSTVLFPDGSKAELNINSQVKFLSKFGETREVQFSGEAYFDIKKSKKPFVIETEEVDVRVLGTAFNVITDRDEIRVLVDRGLVVMETTNNQVKIAKGELGVFDLVTSKMSINTSPPSNVFSWRNGKFSFREVSLESASKELAKFYEVTFDISDAVKNCKITAKFDNVQLKEALNVLEGILGVSIQQNNSIVQIKGKGCQ